MALPQVLLPLSAAILILGGCANTEQMGDKNLFDFLVDGQTSKQQVLLTLGQPSGVYENQSIYTYRIIGDSSKGFKPSKVHSPCGWHNIDYSLVLIFDDQDTLKRHSLVSVQ